MGITIANGMPRVLGLSTMEFSATLVGILMIIALTLIVFSYMNIRKRIDRGEKPSDVIKGFYKWAIFCFAVGIVGMVILLAAATPIHNLFYGKN